MPNPLQFILLDLLGGGFAPVPAERQEQAHSSSSTGMGSVYAGDMPPMLWIQREQQRSRTDAASVNEANTIREQGNRAFREGNHSRAVELYSEAIELDPTNSISYSNRSLTYHKLGNHAAAMADAREAIHLDVKNYKAYFRLGLALAAVGEHAEALTNFKIAFEHSTSNEDQESIKIQIAKSEAKLARNTQILTPVSPGGNGNGAENRTPGYSTPFPGSAGGSAENTGFASLGSAKLSPAPLPELITAPPALEEVRGALIDLIEHRRVESPLDSTLCDTLSSVFHGERTNKIKNLIALANPEQLAKAMSAVEAAQQNLRQCAKETDRTQFQQAVAARDLAYQNLWSIAEEAKGAVSKLKEMSEEERKVVASLTHKSSPHSFSDQQESFDEPVVRPTTTIESLLEEKDVIQKQLVLLAAASAKTNTAAIALFDKIQEERRLFDELASPLSRWTHVREQLMLHARYFATTGRAESELSSSKMEVIDTIGSALQRVESDAIQFRRNAKLGPQLLEQEAQLERERLFQERQRIHLQAEIEWMKVKDEEPQKIGFMNQRLENSRLRIMQIVERQTEVQRNILALIDSDHPELSWRAVAGGSRIMKWIKGSGLWMNCSFSDFRVTATLSSTISSKVYLSVYRGEEVALKEIPMEGEKARRRFQNEINITLGSSNHPNIIKVLGVFFDGPFAYLVMPYLRRGSLKALLAKKEPIAWFKIQEMFRQLASGLAHLHDRGIVHADIKPSNVLFTEEGIPVITDFGIAKDYGRFGEREMTQTITVSGTADFMAPELLNPPKDSSSSTMPTTKSDIWSLGVTMYCVAAANTVFQAPADDDNASNIPLFPVPLPGANCVFVPPAYVGGSERLADLLSQALTVDPDQRPSAIEILSHPYFAVSLVEDLVNNKELVESNAKLEALRSYIHVLRAGCRTPVLVSVVRNHMVESVSNIFECFQEAEIIRPIMVVFQGEQGVDEGALTTEMLTQYFQQLITKQKLVVCSKTESESESDGGDGQGATMFLGSEYTITADPRAPEKQLIALGKVLLKCVVENRPLPMQLNASLLKFIAGTEVTLQDLESYDRTLHQNLKRILLFSSDELEAADLDFSEFPAAFLERERISHDITCQTKVGIKNVRDFVNLRVKYELIGKRETALQHIKTGFLMSPLLTPHMRLLSATELMMLLCGQQHIHAQVIIDSLDFQGFPSSSGTPEHLKEILRTSCQNNLRRFLRLCTSAVSLPHGGLSRKIKVLCTADTARLPVGHSCVFQLDLPDYDDPQLLRSKLATALAHVNDGFHIA